MNSNEILKKLNSQERKNFININDFTNNLMKKGNIMNDVKQNPNSKFSNLNKKLTIEILSCLKGDSVIPPTKRFYSVYDLDNLPNSELTENLLDIQKTFLKITNKYEEVLVSNAQKTLNMEKQIYNDLINKTNAIFSDCDNKVKDSEKIMSHLYEKLNNEFEKKIAKDALSQFNLIDNNLSKLKGEILHKEQYIENQKERLNIILNQTDKITKTVDNFLVNNGENDIDQTLSESTIDNLYNQYKNMKVDKTTKTTKTTKPTKKITQSQKTYQPVSQKKALKVKSNKINN